MDEETMDLALSGSTGEDMPEGEDPVAFIGDDAMTDQLAREAASGNAQSLYDLIMRVVQGGDAEHDDSADDAEADESDPEAFGF
jgi:hypothetical protein